jgi:peptide/nickel transport system permease protein
MKHDINTGKKRSYYADAIKRFKRHKFAIIGLIILFLEIVLVIIMPVIMDLDPYSIQDVRVLSGPVPNHPLGIDRIGRDNFSRFVYGGRVSLFVGMVSSLISLVVGTPLGLIAGYYRGVIEVFIMRLVEIFMSFPSMVIILVLAAVFGPSTMTLTIVIGILGWPPFARLLYANVLSYKEKEYVEGAQAIGTRNLTIMTKYILPNAFSPVLVAFTFRTAAAIIQESSLSFLGMGVQAPQASWGNILNMAQSITILSRMPWIWMPSGIAMVITVLSINFVGDGMRDAFDPKMKL